MEVSFPASIVLFSVHLFSKVSREKWVFNWKPTQYRLVSVLKQNTEPNPYYILKGNGDLILQASRRGLRGSLDLAAPSHSGSLTRYSPTQILYSQSTWFPSDAILIPDLCPGSSATAAFPQSQGPSLPISALKAECWHSLAWLIRGIVRCPPPYSKVPGTPVAFPPLDKFP